ncbi:hypothetical protein Nepgr_018408 [Nepenthes gracilis]|uniref:PRONE domain-containing protein n=1 Tax=Nepenthes gracilis TaxID=150966 RepID=A0AAD3SSV1_NEPGR|nr:hypothetical protein Nepgr_018408 [Nepenthes gracilis]
MVRAFDLHKSSCNIPERKTHASVEPSGGGGTLDDRQTKTQGAEMEIKTAGIPINPSDCEGPISRLNKAGTAAGSSPRKAPSDMELMKERFAKLLLGEDMSGGGKGVSSALALSDAITNLSASVFGEQRRLEPIPRERRSKWRKEMDWLLAVTDHIVELVPSQQQSPDGTSMEVVVTRQRGDLLVNIPALRKLDNMLTECLDNFEGTNEFQYVDSQDEKEYKKATKKRLDGRWWIPAVEVPSCGLSEVTRKWLQYQKNSVNQVLKAAMAINAQVLSEMEIPESYMESLPKNGRASLGDMIYKSITDDVFDPEKFLAAMDLTSEHKVLELKNRIEATIVIWQRKMTQKDGKSSWGSSVSFEKRELFEERAETILLILEQQFPGIPQSSLDISKIQYNKDVGHAVLESYSRVLESLASTIMGRIDDVLYADSLARSSPVELNGKQPSLHFEEKIKNPTSKETPNSMTLMDFIDWNLDDKENNLKGDLDEYLQEENEKLVMRKTTHHNNANKKLSYIERLENWGGLRSPTARH